MKRVHNFSRPMFIWIAVFTLLTASCMAGSGYFGLLTLFGKFAEIFDPASGMADMQRFMQQADILKGRYLFFGLPFLFVFFLFWGLSLWLILRRRLGKDLLPEHRADTPGKAEIKKPGAPLEKIVYRVDRNKEKRLYAHLLGVFQREGRLVDFLNEDLEGYEDAQVGAAVRNIHGNCRKALDRLVKLKAVADHNEGEEIAVKEGFDPAAIRLVGNVKGEPPFKGIIRHRGWRIETLNIPDLSGDEYAGILEPAEVEIL
jgi:hypothetical protein